MAEARSKVDSSSPIRGQNIGVKSSSFIRVLFPLKLEKFSPQSTSGFKAEETDNDTIVKDPTDEMPSPGHTYAGGVTQMNVAGAHHGKETNDVEKYSEKSKVRDRNKASPAMVIYFWCTFVSLIFALVLIPTFATEAVIKNRGIINEEYWFPDLMKTT